MHFLLGYDDLSFKILGFLILNQFLIGIIQFIRSNLTGLHRFREEAFLSVLDRILLIVICSALLWTDIFSEEFTIMTFVKAQLIAYLGAMLMAFILVSKHIKPFSIKFNAPYTRTLLKQSLPYAILIFLMFIYNRIDAIMLERLVPNGTHEAGIYAQGFRYLDAVNMIALLFAGLLLPIYSRLIKANEEIFSMVLVPFKLLIPGAILIGVLGFNFASTIMGWRYIAETEASAPVFSLLIISFIPIALTYIFGTLLTANGNLKALNYMAFFGVVLNLTLNFILIPKYQAKGAAVATLITQCLTAGIQMILAFRIFSFKIEWSTLTKTIIFTLLIIGINTTWLSDILGLQFASQNQAMLIYFIIGIVLLFGLRLIKISDFIPLLKKSTLNDH